MDEKKKILLGEKDIMSRDNEDLFININLNSTFSEIRNDTYTNVFDVEKQWKKERNTSRDFRIYGIIDSTVVGCDNLTLYAYDSAFPGTGINSGTTQLSGLVSTIQSSELVYGGLNSYAKKRGKYLFEISGYTKDFIYFKIPTNNTTYKDQVFAQQLIFRDSEGNFIEYGTKTVDITEDGNALDINNDFYFLYNKHWIKKDLLVIEEKPAKISFSASPIFETVTETPLFSPSTVLSPFYVILDKPSPFGLEQVSMNIFSSTLDPTTEIGVTDSTFTIQAMPFNINFAPGEQIKKFYFFSPQDFLQEFIEDVTFELNNFQYVNTGSPLTHTFYIDDSTPKNRALFNFQNVFENRDYFTGIVQRISSTDWSYPMPSVLRNGLKYEGTPMEFYPSTNFTLKIKNLGTNTILPINSSIGVSSEQIFLAGQQLSFGINLNYQNTEKHSIKFYFKDVNATSMSSSMSMYAQSSGLTINGIPIVDYYKSYKVDYEKFLSCFKNTNTASSPSWSYAGGNISGWNRYDLEIPFSITEDLSAKTITIIAKSPGTRLDVVPYGGFPDIFSADSAVLQVFGITAETIQEFVYSAQTPFEILLGANDANNFKAKYEFELLKNGFDTMTFVSSSVNASTAATTYYLVSGYHNVLRNWDNTTNTPVYVHDGVTSNWISSVSSGLYDSGEAYINGIVFLANKYFDNTQNTGIYIYGTSSLNSTNFSNLAGDYSADFLPAPIVVIPETNEYYSVQDTAQVGYLGIRSANGSYITDPNINSTRSFDFRTGSTGPYNTYYFDNYSLGRAQWEWNSYSSFYSSGGTVGTNQTSPPRISIRQFLQDGAPANGITDQGLNGTVYPVLTVAEGNSINSSRGPGSYFSNPLDWIKLTARTPGIPFEFTNFIELRYLSGPNIGTNFSNDTMCYVEVQPNEIFGITLNKANNYMGGFSLVRP